MKILNALKNSSLRSLKSWKGLLIIWFLSLLLVSMVATPMKGALKSAFGDSMITDKLKDGFDVEVFADLGVTLKSLISYFKSGFIMAILTGLLLNAFLTGGLFNSLKGSLVKFSVSEFFRASAKNFWTFLVISFIISLIIFILAILIIVLPITMVGQAVESSEITIIKTGIVVISTFIFLLAILLLVADYARAWQVIQDRNRPFSAIGFGFGQTFRTFLSSFPLMIILLLVQLLYAWLIFTILPGMNPVTGGGVFLLFLVSQFLFFFKILLRAWRYGSVTALMEMNRAGD